VTSTAALELWDTIARDAIAESSLWGDALRPEAERERDPVFSPLGEERFALGLETIYEGYLVHYGSPRLFAPVDQDTALLLGDYLYAHGLVRVADAGGVIRVMLTLPHWDDFARGCLDDIIAASAGSPLVLVRTRDMLTRLGPAVPGSGQQVLARRLQWVEDTLARNFPVVWADIASDSQD